ncbi:MAG: cysteine hydrolase [Desulfobacterales bacterium]|nr:cysteine hydrolase [Desulfobacterales bacterium]MDD4072605.1 cysteine hydrolase [Desulfobacterales bacterium]MDD4392361.1 cysteine hydrolase [Desulfobacterales bacterium]
MPKRALVIVDMLNDFMNENGSLYCGESSRKIIPFIQQRLNTHRQQADLIIFLQDTHDPDDKEFEKFPPHCVKGTWGNQIIRELAPVSGEKVIPKKRYSGFYGTDLDQVLKSSDINEVEVVGVCTSICIMDTVGGLANRDYFVIVPADGVADFDPNFHEFALKRMKQTYGATIQ